MLALFFLFDRYVCYRYGLCCEREIDTMSNHQNEMILERLYDEAVEELLSRFKPYKMYGHHSACLFRSEEDLHNAAVELAKKRWETDYD